MGMCVLREMRQQHSLNANVHVINTQHALLNAHFFCAHATLLFNSKTKIKNLDIEEQRKLIELLSWHRKLCV